MLRSLFRRSDVETRAIQSTPWGPWGSSSATAAGQSVTSNTALNLLTVYGCVNLISDTIATLPLGVFRKDSSGLPQQVATPRVLEQPNVDTDRTTFVTQVVSSLLLDGNAYVIAAPSSLMPERLTTAHPDDVTYRDEQGTTVPYFKGVRPPPEQWMHIKALTLPGQYKGLSPVESARQALGLGLAAQEFGARFFGSGQNPSGVIEFPGEISPDQAAIIRQKWSRDHSGLSNSHQPGVLTGGATWKPISVTPEQAQFLDTRRFTASEIAAQMFLVDPTMLGIQQQGSSLTYQNLEQRGIHLAQYTLMRWIVRLEKAFSAMLPRPQYVKFNLGGLQRADLKTRYEAYAIGLAGAPFLMVDEARQKEELGPMPTQLIDEELQP